MNTEKLRRELAPELGNANIEDVRIAGSDSSAQTETIEVDISLDGLKSTITAEVQFQSRKVVIKGETGELGLESPGNSTVFDAVRSKCMWAVGFNEVAVAHYSDGDDDDLQNPHGIVGGSWEW